jgi:hypothetical protein
MHAHFYHIAAAPAQHEGLWFEDSDDDDHDAVWSVDSFALVPTPLLTLLVPTRAADAFLFGRPDFATEAIRINE